MSCQMKKIESRTSVTLYRGALQDRDISVRKNAFYRYISASGDSSDNSWENAGIAVYMLHCLIFSKLDALDTDDDLSKMGCIFSPGDENHYVITGNRNYHFHIFYMEWMFHYHIAAEYPGNYRCYECQTEQSYQDYSRCGHGLTLFYFGSSFFSHESIVYCPLRVKSQKISNY